MTLLNKNCIGPPSKPVVGVCDGDSGGALACIEDNKIILTGIASYAATCGRKDFPGVFDKVFSFLDWIMLHIVSWFLVI